MERRPRDRGRCRVLRHHGPDVQGRSRPDRRLLWQAELTSGIVGQPVTYRGPDGKQYVAILSGVGGWAGAIVSANIDTRDRSAALGMANAMKDLPAATPKGGTLYVFALP